LLTAFALWLVHPFMTSRLIGSGDAWWYGNMLRDFLTQLRSGIFPVWTGQTEFAFNGAVHPLRAAPYYQYFGGLLDLLTLRRLDAFTLQHATVVVSLVAAVAITYWSLCRLVPSRRNLAAVLTALYVACPAVLGLAASMDLYMSVMAIPFLPLVTCGLALSLGVCRPGESAKLPIAGGSDLAKTPSWAQTAEPRSSSKSPKLFGEPCRSLLVRAAAAGLAGDLTPASSFAKATEDRSRAPVGRSFMRRPKLAPTIAENQSGEGGPVSPTCLAEDVRRRKLIKSEGGPASPEHKMSEGGWPAQRMIVVGLALTWYAHAPLAAWLTLITVGVQAVRLLLNWRSRQVWRETFGSALLLAGLVAAVFVSVAALRGGDTASIIPYAIDRAKIIAALREAFPSCLLPVRMPAVNLGDLQLGYALWAVLLAGGVFALTPGRRRYLSLAVPAALLVVMLLPVPDVTVWLWNAIPESLTRLTFYWPMHRLCPVLAALALPLGMLALSSWLPRWEVPSNKYQVSRNAQPRATGAPLSPSLSLSPSLPPPAEGASAKLHTSEDGPSPSLSLSLPLSLLAALAVIWAAWQADTLVTTVMVRTASWHDTVVKRRPENAPLMNHAYGLSLALPPYFSNGVMDPWFELRVLVGGKDVQDNATAVLAGHVALWTDLVTISDPNPGVWDLSPSLTLQPGRRQLLEFDFGGQSHAGTLQIEGEHFFRQYRLPASGQPLAFGSAASMPHRIPLWTTSDRPEEIQVRFIPDQDTATYRPPVFARFRWHTVDLRSLPLRIDSYAPLRITASLQRPGLLETFRMYFPGYQAKVDGRPAPVIPSLNRMVAVSLPAGTHTVEISYRPPWLLQLALAVSAATWMGLLASALRRRVAR
jgi:hypothetical protein